MFLTNENPRFKPTRPALPAGMSMAALGYGRFVQTDPIGYADGMNWYAYVKNDPVNNVDSSGLASCFIDGKTKIAAPGVSAKQAESACLALGGAWGDEVIVNGSRTSVYTVRVRFDNATLPVGEGRASTLRGDNKEETKSTADTVCELIGSSEAQATAIGGFGGMWLESLAKRSGVAIQKAQYLRQRAIGSIVMSPQARMSLWGARAGPLGAAAGFVFAGAIEKFYPGTVAKFEKKVIAACQRAAKKVGL